jgi:hypothetical protein
MNGYCQKTKNPRKRVPAWVFTILEISKNPRFAPPSIILSNQFIADLKRLSDVYTLMVKQIK